MMNPDRLLALYEQVAEAPDAIARMRRFVLHLAVRGKLATQDASDEPASELLKRIAAEKARLVKAGEIRKQNPLARIETDELPFDLPLGWAWVRLGTLIDLISGQHLQPPEYSEDPAAGLPYITGPSDFGSDGLVIRRHALIRKAVATRGQLLLTVKGSGVGKATICDLDEVAISRQLMALTAISWEPDFLELVADRLATKLQEEARSLIPGISREDVTGFVVALPPLAEQRRIVAKVEELKALLDRLEAARTASEATRDRLTAASLARLTAPNTDPADFPANARFALATLPALTTRPDQIKPLRQTILNLAVRGKLVDQDPTDEPALDYLLGLDEMPPKARKQLKPLDPSECGGDLPASWAWLPLAAIIRGMDAGWSPQCENHPRSSADEWGVLKTTAVQALAFDSMQHKLLPSKLTPRPEFQAEEGDILVTRAGPKNRVGVSCVVDVPCPKLMISDKLIRFHAVGDLSARYIALTLNAGFTFEQIEAAKSGMAVMQMNISQAKLRAIPIPLPPRAEQHRIAAKVDALMALCDRLEAVLTTADTTRARLLEALLHEALDTAAAALEAAE